MTFDTSTNLIKALHKLKYVVSQNSSVLKEIVHIHNGLVCELFIGFN